MGIRGCRGKRGAGFPWSWVASRPSWPVSASPLLLPQSTSAAKSYRLAARGPGLAVASWVPLPVCSERLGVSLSSAWFAGSLSACQHSWPCRVFHYASGHSSCSLWCRLWCLPHSAAFFPSPGLGSALSVCFSLCFAWGKSRGQSHTGLAHRHQSLGAGLDAAFKALQMERIDALLLGLGNLVSQVLNLGLNDLLYGPVVRASGPHSHARSRRPLPPQSHRPHHRPPL